MNPVLLEGDQIEFVPGPGWKWSGWDGKLKFQASGTRSLVLDRAVGTVADVERLAELVLGKQYTADSFKDAPGTVATCTVRASAEVRSDVLRVSGDAAAMAVESIGSFRCSMVPSLRIGDSTTPDPQASSRSGEVRLVRTQNRLAWGTPA